MSQHSLPRSPVSARPLPRPARFACLAALLVWTVSAGPLACAFGEIRPNDPFNRQFSLEEKHKRYSDLVRWSKFDEAAAFMESDDRAAFFAAMPDFGEVRFTDWEAEPWKLDDEMRETSIRVTYTGYAMASPIEVEVHETQLWTRTGKGNNWSVRSSFEDMDRLAGN